MSLSDWAKAGWLQPHETSRQQITGLFGIVDRDLEDAARGLSADWQFGIAYNAVLKLCTILLYARGWRPEKTLAHYRTLQALPLILGKDWQDGRRLPRHLPKQAQHRRIRHGRANQR
jgi:hypothetical protein